MRSKLSLACPLTVLALLFYVPANANVPTPPQPPPVPADFCGTIYSELQGYLDSFNQTLGNPAPYPTIQFGQLQRGDSNAGPALVGAGYINGAEVQVQQLKAMGFQGVKVQVAFPVLYQPFFGSADAMQPYLDFYTNLANFVHSQGMKLLVENNVTLSTGTGANWPTVGAFYNTLDWPTFIAARATMAGTIAQYLQPDFLMLSEEPDTEAANAGQPNLNNPTLAASMIAGEITAARAASPSSILGAGFGTWMGPYPPSDLNDYLNAYLALPMDYLDMHIYPINTEYGGINLLNNALVMANAAATANPPKPVAISEAWVHKMEDAEFSVTSADIIRERDAFSFWAPIDTYFLQTIARLANYTQMLYLTVQGNDQLLAYQTYGGTTANGGASNCTCTTASCSPGDITSAADTLAGAAGQSSQYTTTAFAENALLVTTPDTTTPTPPSNLTGTTGYNSATLQWNPGTDNIGVAGYNVLRCSVQPCTAQDSFQWVANSAATTYYDLGLTENTTYEYQVQTFDMAGNMSTLSNTISVTTALKTPPNAPQNPAATATSPQQITLTWTAPQNGSGLGEYLIYGGPTLDPLGMVQIGVAAPTSTSYVQRFLTAATTYCYGVIAVEQGLNSPMSSTTCATTMPLPNAPGPVTGTSSAPTRITVSWTELQQPGGLPISNYQVYEGTVSGHLTKVATTKATSYTAQKLTPSTTYYFAVIAVDTRNDSSPMSDQIAVTTMPLPNAPVNVSATVSSSTLFKLSWQWSQAPGGLGPARYLVNCGISPTNPPNIATTTATSYTDNKATAGTTYYCNVVAVDTANDDSAPSAIVQVTMPPLPNSPVILSITAPSSTKVALTWQWSQAPGGLGLARYQVNCGISPTNIPNVITTTATSYTYNKATAGTEYYCDVVGVDTGNDSSPPSNVASVTTPPPPNAPNNLAATVNSASRVTVTWSETPPQGGLQVNNYKIYRSTTLPVTVNNYIATRPSLSYTDTTVTGGNTYYYAIAAVDSGQSISALSAPAEADTPLQ